MFLFGNLTWTQARRLIFWWFINKGPRRDVTVDTLDGRLTFDSRDWLIGKYLYVKRQHEEHEIREAVRLAESEGYLIGPSTQRSMMNVGANIGMTCVSLMGTGRFDRGIAVEPAPDNYRLLKKNIDQNNLTDHIEPLEMALSSIDGHVPMEISSDNGGDHRVRKTDRAGFYQEERRSVISVAARKLDSLPDELKKDLALIWVDIQGHEGHFFQGGRNFLSRAGIPVISEFWPYGIDRSGITRSEYLNSLSGIFSHFWIVGRSDVQRVPIEEVGRLFEEYATPRNFCLLLLAPRSGQ